MNTMQAWTYTRRGSPSSVLSLSTIPKPEISSLRPNEVMVKVLYAGVLALYANLMRRLPHLTSNPWIPEAEFSGVVEATGSLVSRVKVGDEVFGGQDPTTHLKRGGVLAQYIVLHEDLVVKKPDTVSLEEVAGLAPSTCAAVQFAERSEMSAGMKVLVTAAASMTGMAMVQMARHVVGESGVVVGTCSSASEKAVKEMGVDETIDYRSNKPLNQYLTAHHSAEKFNIIIEIAGDDPCLYEKSPAYLTEKGKFIFAGKIDTTHDPAKGLLDMITWSFGVLVRTNVPILLGGTPRIGVLHSTRLDKASLDKSAALVESGEMKIPVSRVYEMEDLIKAYEAAEDGCKGMIVIRVQ